MGFITQEELANYTAKALALFTGVSVSLTAPLSQTAPVSAPAPIPTSVSSTSLSSSPQIRLDAALPDSLLSSIRADLSITLGLAALDEADLDSILHKLSAKTVQDIIGAAL